MSGLVIVLTILYLALLWILVAFANKEAKEAAAKHTAINEKDVNRWEEVKPKKLTIRKGKK